MRPWQSELSLMRCSNGQLPRGAGKLTHLPIAMKAQRTLLIIPASLYAGASGLGHPGVLDPRRHRRSSLRGLLATTGKANVLSEYARSIIIDGADDLANSRSAAVHIDRFCVPTARSAA
jgi:hypothetical protein